MIDEINKVIEKFEKLGYSHEEAVNIVEPATTLSDEELERIADEFGRISCTSFQMTADELKEILGKQEKKEYAIDERLTNDFFSSDLARPLKITFEGDLKDE